MKMNNLHNKSLSSTITALNILDGMDHRTHWEILQPAWEEEGMGFVEFCGWVASLALYSEESLAKHQPQDFPGVYDYEVSYTVGELITRHVVCAGKLPSHGEVCRWFDVTADQFFQKDKDGQ